MSNIASIAIDFMGRGGKKLRPRLCQAAYAACGGVDDLSQVAEAVECFHKASLVHDDIQDGDETRYGRPTVWKEHGVAVAIAVGDWLVARGYQLIAHSGFANAAKMLAATVDSHLRLCEGQGDDLLNPRANPLQETAAAFDESAYISVCERKTGEAFALAAQLGALAAGADDAPYRAFGLAYGVLFQINDDLADGAQQPLLAELKCRHERRLESMPVADLIRRHFN